MAKLLSNKDLNDRAKDILSIAAKWPKTVADGHVGIVVDASSSNVSWDATRILVNHNNTVFGDWINPQIPRILVVTEGGKWALYDSSLMSFPCAYFSGSLIAQSSGANAQSRCTFESQGWNATVRKDAVGRHNNKPAFFYVSIETIDDFEGLVT